MGGTLTLDPVTHEYAVDAKPVLGVSKILAAAGLVDNTWISEEGLKRGSYVHQTIEYYVQQDLDEALLNPKLVGYLNAWKAFQKDSGFKVQQVDGKWQVEIKKAHPLYGYAGTMDYLGHIGTRFLVVDLKSGAPDDWHGFQLAGYAMLNDFPAGSPRPDRANLYVRDDGTYRFIERKDRGDFDVFKAAITIARTRMGLNLFK